jgi:hypothetical protein
MDPEGAGGKGPEERRLGGKEEIRGDGPRGCIFVFSNGISWSNKSPRMILYMD